MANLGKSCNLFFLFIFVSQFSLIHGAKKQHAAMHLLHTMPTNLQIIQIYPSTNSTMAKGAGKSPAKLKEPKKNANGEIMNWDSNWSDAIYLRMLVEKEEVDGMTVSQVQKHFPQFQKYSNKPLTGGLKTARNSFAKESDMV
jgi:hypothetical protein